MVCEESPFPSHAHQSLVVPSKFGSSLLVCLITICLITIFLFFSGSIGSHFWLLFRSHMSHGLHWSPQMRFGSLSPRALRQDHNAGAPQIEHPAKYRHQAASGGVIFHEIFRRKASGYWGRCFAGRLHCSSAPACATVLEVLKGSSLVQFLGIISSTMNFWNRRFLHGGSFKTKNAC